MDFRLQGLLVAIGILVLMIFIFRKIQSNADKAEQERKEKIERIRATRKKNNEWNKFTNYNDVRIIRSRKQETEHAESYFDLMAQKQFKAK